MNRHLGRILLILGILIAILIFLPLLIPIPPLKDTVPPAELADPDSRFAQVDGLQVHYKTAGTGDETWFLLHGFGASLFSWQKVLDPLAQGRTIVAYDRPAFGLTERPLPGTWHGQSPYSTQAQARQAIALLDHLGVEQTVLVGNSAGGTVALVTALQAPERISALVLVSPAVYSNHSYPNWIIPLLRTPQMRRLGPWLVRSIASRGEAIIYDAWHDPSLINDETLLGYKRPLLAENWDKALWELVVARDPQDLPAQLSKLALPILIITGDDDRIVPTADSIRLADELPTAELVILANCGHVPQEECPQEFLTAIKAWQP